MDELYFSVDLGSDHTLCLAPITERRLEMAGRTDLSDTSGYFLFEQRGHGDFATIEILAQVMSVEGVERLREAFSMS